MKTTTTKIQPNSPVEPGEFSLYIEYDSFDEDLLGKVTKPFFLSLKEKIKLEIPQLLTYANFLGEAEIYMASKGIPYSPLTRTKYAKAIREELLAQLDDLLIFNDSDGSISMSPYIMSLENGDFYRPALGFISKCIKEWLEKEYQTNK